MRGDNKVSLPSCRVVLVWKFYHGHKQEVGIRSSKYFPRRFFTVDGGNLLSFVGSFVVGGAASAGNVVVDSIQQWR